MQSFPKVMTAALLAMTAGAVLAQSPVVEKPVNRFYGTARPPGQAGPPPASFSPQHGGRPGPAVGGSVYLPPPVARPPSYYHHPAPRPRIGVDVMIGAPFYRPYYQPYWGSAWYDPFWRPYPSVVLPAPMIVSPPQPMVYIERSADPAQPAAGFWYWCASPQGWYPEVSECPQGWQAVPPRAAQ